MLFSKNNTTRTFFTDDLISSDFLTALEEKELDLDTEILTFQFFCMSAASSCTSKLGSKLNRKSKSASLIQHNELSTQFSGLNLNLNFRKVLNKGTFTIPDFETVFIETPK